MFKKAERKKVKVKLALTGPSGSGKTYSALKIAAGLTSKNGGKVAVLDTENGSASLYAGLAGIPEFDVVDLAPPFTTDRFIQIINGAVKAGYDVLIMDSTSHQWQGEGSVMDRKDKEQLAKPTMNSYTLWSKYTPEHERFKAAILQSPIHIIATMRSKQDYQLQTNDKGKVAPCKLGMAPIQRDGAEYEYTTVFDLNMEHIASISKDRTGLFDAQFFKPDETTGVKILDWLETGKEAEPDRMFEVKKLLTLKSELNISDDGLKQLLIEQNYSDSLKQLNPRQLKVVNQILEAKKQPATVDPEWEDQAMGLGPSVMGG